MLIEILDEITEETRDDVKALIAGVPITEPITLKINSVGGCVFSTFDIINSLKEYTTTAIISGMACSSASILAFSCQNIQMYQNSFLMIHKASCGIYGNANDLLKQAEFLEKVDNQILSSYKNFLREGITYDLSAALSNETWLDSLEASEIFNIQIIGEEANLSNKIVAKAHFKKIPDKVAKVLNQTEEPAPKFDIKEHMEELANLIVSKLDQRQAEKETLNKQEQIKQNIFKNLGGSE